MSTALSSLGAWTWLVVAAVLMILELALPGVFLLWLGIAAGATGLLALVLDLSWERELLLFAVFALAAVLVGRNLMGRAWGREERPFLNRRADALVGRRFVLSEPIAGGVGRVRIDDGIWRVVGQDMPAGTGIVVVRIDGSDLVVERSEELPS